jgi:hypothetical protein
MTSSGVKESKTISVNFENVLSPEAIKGTGVISKLVISERGISPS